MQEAMNVSDLGSAEKVAALLLSLLATDRALVAKILDKFDSEELELVTKASARIGALPPARVAQNIHEFLARWQEGPSIIGNERNSKVLLEAAAEHRHDEAGTAQTATAAEKTVWERCEGLPLQKLISSIAAEPPQIAALWLSQLSPSLSSDVLSRLSVNQASDVIGRLASIEAPKPQAIAFLEKYVGELIAATESESDMGQNAALRVVTQMPPEIVDVVMSRLEEEQPDVAVRLRKNMFKFVDLVKLPLPARIAIFERITADKIIAALNGADMALVECILDSVVSRTRRMIELELKSQEPVSRKQVNAARQEIVSVILQLLREGVIVREEESTDARPSRRSYDEPSR
jgi:flagellar motor switch protein FliG